MSQGMLLREVAAKADIDPSLLSRIERGTKQPPRELVRRLSGILKAPQRDIMIQFLSDRILYSLKGEKLALEAMQVAEENITYNRKRSG